MFRRSGRPSAEELAELERYRAQAAEAIVNCGPDNGNSQYENEIILRDIDVWLGLHRGIPKTSEQAQDLIHEYARVASNVKFWNGKALEKSQCLA